MTKYVVTLDPTAFVLSTKTVFDWRFTAKRELLKKRGYKSDFSGLPLSDVTGAHMHEGIVTRAIVPKSVWWHILIYHEVNCVLLRPEEHLPQPPSRDWCIQWAYECYGREVVQEWFYNLPFKSIPFQLP